MVPFICAFWHRAVILESSLIGITITLSCVRFLFPVFQVFHFLGLFPHFGEVYPSYSDFLWYWSGWGAEDAFLGKFKCLKMSVLNSHLSDTLVVYRFLGNYFLQILKTVFHYHLDIGVTVKKWETTLVHLHIKSSSCVSSPVKFSFYSQCFEILPLNASVFVLCSGESPLSIRNFFNDSHYSLLSVPVTGLPLEPIF